MILRILKISKVTFILPSHGGPLVLARSTRHKVQKTEIGLPFEHCSLQHQTSGRRLDSEVGKADAGRTSEIDV